MLSPMAVDVLATQGAWAWVAMVMISSSQNIPLAASEGLNLGSFKTMLMLV